MDFHCLSRRDLQSLCKRNKIPANMTNIAMADALRSLQSVEGLAEIQEAALQFQSPEKLDLVSPAVPRTGRRTTASRKVAPAKGQEKEEEEEGPKERQASPLPRARRVTARASDILNMAYGPEEEEEEATKKDVPETPRAPNTRRKPSKKGEGIPENPAGQKTAAAATRRRAAKKEECEEVPMRVAMTTTGRRARQSSKKEAGDVSATGGDDLMSGGLRRSTRARGRSAAVEMASLAKEEDDEGEKREKEAEDSIDQKNDLYSEAKDQDYEKDLILEEKCSGESIQEEKREKPSEKSNQNQEEHVDDALTGLEDSPIRGLIASSDQAPSSIEDLHQDSVPLQNLSAEISDEAVEIVERSSEEEKGSALKDKILLQTEDSAPETEEETESTLSGEIPTQIEASGLQSLDLTSNEEMETTAEEVEGLVIGSPEKESSGDDLAVDLGSDTTSEAIGSDGDQSDAEKGSEHLTTVQIPVEIDESGADLSCNVLAGEISVEAIGNQESPSAEAEVVGESANEVEELIEDLSDLKLSAGKELPPREENADVEVGPRGGSGGSKAEKPKYDENMSLRKLKAAYKETLINNKGEEKRAALKAIDENCI